MSIRKPHQVAPTSNNPDDARDSGAGRLARFLGRKFGRSGAGASGAMVQIAQDRMTDANFAMTAAEQIMGLWRARAEGQRKLADIRNFQTWLTANYPELLPLSGDSHAYLMGLVRAETEE